jgi:hypothetical protein
MSVNHTTDKIHTPNLGHNSYVPTQEHASTVFVDNVYWHPRESKTIFTSGPSQAWNVMVHAYVTDCSKLWCTHFHIHIKQHE